MKSLHDLQEILDEQIKKVTRKGDITPPELEAMYKAVDIIKDITTIEAMQNAEKDTTRRGNSYGDNDMPVHSTRYYPHYMYYDNTPNNDGMSNAQERDAKGRYTSRGMRYSRAEAKDKMVEKLEKMLDSTTSAKDREIIRTCIEDLEKG